MCVVSMISDHYQNKPRDYWTNSRQLDDYNELVRKAKEYDRIMKQPDCVKPELDELNKRIEDILKQKGLL